MSYLVLGCPRSGTNLLSSLIKNLEGVYYVVEPLSMNVKWVLRDDLIWSNHNHSKLMCDCSNCFLCQLKKLCQSNKFAFKETSLFEYLPALVGEFNIKKVVYIERNILDVVHSYLKHSLLEKWNIIERKYYNNRILAYKCHDDSENKLLANYAYAVTQQKRKCWHKYRDDIDYIEVTYEELIDEPLSTIKIIAEYLKCDVPVNMEKLVKSKFNGKKRSYTYGTFGQVTST